MKRFFSILATLLLFAVPLQHLIEPYRDVVLFTQAHSAAISAAAAVGALKYHQHVKALITEPPRGRYQIDIRIGIEAVYHNHGAVTAVIIQIAAQHYAVFCFHLYAFITTITQITIIAQHALLERFDRGLAELFIIQRQHMMSAEDRAVTHDAGRDPEDDQKQNDGKNNIE